MSEFQLETERLGLRRFLEADLDEYFRICTHPEIGTYLGVGAMTTKAEAWRSMAMHLGHWELRGFGMWAAFDKSTGTLVGRVGLYQPEGWPGLEVGWLIDRGRWEQGLATEGGRCAMQYAFERLDVPHIVSVIHPLNRRSIRVAEKLGMQPERATLVNGSDVVIYGRDR